MARSQAQVHIETLQSFDSVSVDADGGASPSEDSVLSLIRKNMMVIFQAIMVEFQKRQEENPFEPQLQQPQQPQQQLQQQPQERVTDTSTKEILACLNRYFKEEMIACWFADEVSIDILSKLAGLHLKGTDWYKFEFIVSSAKVVRKATKCLRTLAKRSKKTVEHLCNSYCLDGLLGRLQYFNEAYIPRKNKLIDLKLLLVLIERNVEIRSSLRREKLVLSKVVKILEPYMEPDPRDEEKTLLNDDDADFCTLILKTILQICKFDVELPYNQTEIDQYFSLMTCLKRCILIPVADPKRKSAIMELIYNILKYTPLQVAGELLWSVTERPPYGHSSDDIDDFCSTHDFYTIKELLKVLERLIRNPKPVMLKQEYIHTVMISLKRLCMADKKIMAYCRRKTLEPKKPGEFNLFSEFGPDLKHKLSRTVTFAESTVVTETIGFLFAACDFDRKIFVDLTGYMDHNSMFIGHHQLPPVDIPKDAMVFRKGSSEDSNSAEENERRKEKLERQMQQLVKRTVILHRKGVIDLIKFDISESVLNLVGPEIRITPPREGAESRPIG
ncbi:hypothetical protein HELRODRAFT_194513 [Helobdella robusta]|uniref:Uncharacterized protein n=1 Tax=Helobdella robusta TaxID=6412 RepID=T1FW51_HELRO|nr:hypothetical protein HELRODRAFT_194513 [Helobdella robusta]ESN91177.1 hypothetical protein HELRODRAFT_194513 [Helobdella robusta]